MPRYKEENPHIPRLREAWDIRTVDDLKNWPRCCQEPTSPFGKAN